MPTPPVAFDPIVKETISAQIRSQLIQRITIGEFAPGQPLPSERDLAARFRVARTSVREAISGLLSLGLVERRGNRSYIAECLPDLIVGEREGRKVFVTQLFETREVLEAPIFRLAARRANASERESVAAIARRFVDGLAIAEFRSLDREFHTTIAASCANPLLIELYGKVLDELFRSDEFDALLGDEANRPPVRRIINEACRAHQAIAEAFVAGDANAIGVLAAEHIRDVQRAMIDELI